MAVVAFVSRAVVAFDPAVDTLHFADVSRHAGDHLSFVADGVNLKVYHSGQVMTLLNTSYATLTSSSVTFADGSLFVKGTIGDDALAGTSLDDHFDLSSGGSDEVNAGSGNDDFVLGSALSVSDSIDGGAGISDTAYIYGDYSDFLVFNATTVTGVENFYIGAGTIKLMLHEGMMNGTSIRPDFRADGQDSLSTLFLDASKVFSSFFFAGGRGVANVTGGEGNDSLHGGIENSDFLEGGRGHDQLFSGSKMVPNVGLNPTGVDTQAISTIADTAWKLAAIADFNGDGKSDLLWRNSSTGANLIWKGADSGNTQDATTIANQDWQITSAADYTGDGKADIIWRNETDGGNVMWAEAQSGQATQLVTIVGSEWDNPQQLGSWLMADGTYFS